MSGNRYSNSKCSGLVCVKCDGRANLEDKRLYDTTRTWDDDVFAEDVDMAATNDRRREDTRRDVNMTALI